MDDDGASAFGEPRAGRGQAVALLVAHVAILAVAVVLLVGRLPVDLNPGPSSEARACVAISGGGNLTSLTLRSPADAAHRAAGWIRCDPTFLERARDAVRWDYVLIGVLVVGLALAVWRGLQRARWLWSAVFALGFLGIYLGCDLAENRLLSGSLDDLARAATAPGHTGAVAVDWSSQLQWVSAVKFGAFLAAAPMFLISLALACGDVFGERTRVVRPPETDDGAPSTEVAEHVGRPKPVAAPTGVSPSVANPHRRRSFASYWSEPEDRRVPPVLPPLPVATGTPGRSDVPPPTMGVACSGGGIRSAAFNLGALQALDTARATPDDPTEWQRVRTVTAVSGGSYLATAWVSARAGAGVDAERRWSRGSREEDHLRRHSSYIAPGFAGKVWAALRFVLGLLVNLGFIVLAVAAFALPYGWAVGAAQEAVPASGGAPIRFERAGARIELPSGRVVIPVVGSTARLAHGETAHLRRRVPVVTSATDDTGSRDATLFGKLAAAADGRTLPKGTRVLISVARHPTGVRGRVYGCVRAASRDRACRPATARSVVLGPDATLVRARRAVLTTREDAVVRDRALLTACGAHPCERVAKRLHTDLAWIILVAAIALGTIAIAARPRERLHATKQTVFRFLTVLGFALVAVFAVLPALVSWAEGQRWGIEEHRRLIGAGALTVLLALVSQLVPLLGSGTSPSSTGKVVGWFKSVGSKLRPWLVRLAAYIAVPLIVLALFLFFASSGSQRELRPHQLILWLALLGPLLIIGAGADLNEWSLHPYYRERLMSAFGVDPTTLEDREPSLLGGLAVDAIPQLVVCAAANVNDERLTAPGRPVIPWQFTRTAVGAPKLASVFGTEATVPAEDFGGKLVAYQSLWTAVAVSGAAFSPSMGKKTRAERGLMAFGNLRLGVWYPNPAMLAQRPHWYQRNHPRPHYLAKEAFGLHRATDRWIYVTDGGHYENLGLVELLRRGENEIYCFDASGDSTDTFGTMADAMRLAREELNVEIRFDPAHLKAHASGDEQGISDLGVVAAPLIRHTASGDEEPYGWLVFAKLEVPKDAPFDIVDLARTLPKFPNHPTGDQLYTDQKFEAYRALGQYLGEQAAALAQRIRADLDAGRSIPEAVRRAMPPVPSAGTE